MKIRRVCVFCGSNEGNHPEYADAARTFGKLLAENGLEIVYGGGGTGLMGILASASLKEGGTVTGIIPEALFKKELAHRSLTELRVVSTMHERKATMAMLSDAFVALPGGIGTIEEFMEILTWKQLGFHHKPVALLNTAGYFDHLIKFIDHMIENNFARPVDRRLLIIESLPENLLEKLTGNHRIS